MKMLQITMSSEMQVAIRKAAFLLGEKMELNRMKNSKVTPPVTMR